MTAQPNPITTEIIRNAYNAIADDMSAAIARSAYSPIIYEAHDYGIALFNERAELLGQYAGLPLFTGGLDAGVHAVIERYGDDIAAGDVFTVNDSYITGGHLNDVDVIGVLMHQGRVCGYACIRAHWADVGTAEPGFPVNTRNIFQEGVRWGPTRIRRRGEWVRDVIDILRLNSRQPVTIMGDLDAQLSAIALGQKRVDALLTRFGTETIRECTAQIFRSTEQKYREFIRQIPDGVYTAEGVSDNDGTDDDPVVVKVRVTIAGDEIVVDTTGSSRQRRGNLNTGYANTVSAVRLGLALLYPDPVPDVNDGSFRAMRVIAEPGSIFAATEPAPCMRPHPVMLLIDLMIKALAPALPKVVAAGLPGDSWNVFVMDRRRWRRLLQRRSTRRRLGCERLRRRRERRDPLGGRRLPQHAGRDDGEPLPDPHSSPAARPRQRRRRSAARRAQRRQGIRAAGGFARHAAFRPREDAVVGSVRRRIRRFAARRGAACGRSAPHRAQGRAACDAARLDVRRRDRRRRRLRHAARNATPTPCSRTCSTAT